jgi:hypothetical protein
VREVIDLLSTTITYKGLMDENVLSDSSYIKRRNSNHFQIYMPTADKSIGELTITQNMITINYSSELILSEYIIIHDIILQLKTALNGEIDDSKSFLGYLPNGESVYITKNWEQWISYIYSSMKNCKDDAALN